MRGIYFLSRGMGLEALLAEPPDPGHDRRFEEMFVAYAMGLIRARARGRAALQGRLP